MDAQDQNCAICSKSLNDPKVKHSRCVWQISVTYKDGVLVTINRDPKTKRFPCKCSAQPSFHDYKHRDSLVRHISDQQACSKVSASGCLRQLLTHNLAYLSDLQSPSILSTA
jgi:hypothetical protein